MPRHNLPEERVAQKAARGEYTLVVPLDYMLLSFLPDEGEMFAGLYPLGESVMNIRTKFSPEQQKVLKTSTISTRMRVMHMQGLITQVAGLAPSRDVLWQRTRVGKAELNKWENRDKEVSTNGSDA